MTTEYTQFILRILFALGRPRSRWEDNIKLNLREIGINVKNWIRLAQDRVGPVADFVNTVINLRVPYKKQDIL
jgi:hypothetical protein